MLSLYYGSITYFGINGNSSKSNPVLIIDLKL